MTNGGRQSRRAAEDFLIGGGEMGERIRAFDWSKTSLGPPESWPQSLRSAVSILLPSKAQIVLFWGPELITLYNDAYRPVFGGKHPRVLGLPAYESWKELWIAGFRELIEGVINTGEAYWASDRPFFMERFGYQYQEETFFDVSYDPVRDESGRVAGVFCIVNDTTTRVVGERRLKTLRELSARTIEDARSVEDACNVAVRILDGNRHDVPFALIYLRDAEGKNFLLAGSVGLSDTFPAAAPPCVDTTATGEAETGWPFAEVLNSHRAEIVTDLSRRFGLLPGGVWPESPHTAVVLPINAPAQTYLAGLLVIGVSPRRPLDDEYRGFLDMLANQMSTSIANARSYEEERRRAEALAELDRAKTAFFSNVSHEFRTPLTLMLSPVEELLAKSHTELSPSATGQLEIVNRNGLRLLRLVNSLLDFSRIEAGRMQATYEATDLAALTAELVSCFRSATERAGLRLIVDCPPLSELIYVDRDMWEKIVLNLVSNAFKFTFEGEIEVSLRTEFSNSDNSALSTQSSARTRCVVLRVRDTGVGIPPEALPRLFERFYRVDNTRSRTHEGSGIGLALVQDLVKLHGGTVRVVSTVAQGSTFIVTMPRGATHLPADRIGTPGRHVSTARGVTPFIEEALRWLPEDSDKWIENREKQEVSADHSLLPTRPRILVVDDNTDMRNYLARLLSERFEVETAEDGQVALKRAQTMQQEGRPPELVLSDVMMPQLDGFGLLQALRTDPALASIPIILLSARAGEEARIEGAAAGADDYLIKPFSARELLARVEAQVRMAESRRENERRLRDFADTAPAMLWVTEADGSCSFLSHRWYEYTGQTEEEGLGFGWLKAVHADDREEFSRIFMEANCRHEPFAMDYRLRRADGEVRWCMDAGRPRFDERGTFQGYVGSVIDITDRKQAEDALRASEERLRTLAGQLQILVEERTRELVQSQDRLRAFATELNLAEQRERARLATELHDHLQQMLVLGKLKLGQGKRLAEVAPAAAKLMKETDAVLSDALTYTRTLVTELSPLVLRDHGLAAGLKWLGEYMQRHDVTVTVAVPDEELKLPEEQVVLLFQSVRELLINSSKHAGTGTAGVRMERQDGHLHITVRDEGKGFDLGAFAAPADEGTPSGGISSKFGLFSIQERMRAMGGAFEIQSAPDKGTTAMLSLPLTRQARNKWDRQDEPVSKVSSIGRSTNLSPTSPPGHRISVLLVEDHAMVRQGLRSVLDAYEDIQVIGEAANGEEAVRLVNQRYPTVVVMDINMPKMDGIEATGQIKSCHPDTIVIGISVNAAKQKEEAMRRAGAVRLITKEAAVEQLYDVIQEAVRKRSAMV